MDEIIQMFSSPAWWLGSVVFVIVINLISSVIFAFMRKKFAHLLKKWDQRNQESTEFRKVRIKYLSENQNELTNALIRLNHMRLNTVFYLVFAAILLNFGQFSSSGNTSIETVSLVLALMPIVAASRSIILWGKEALLIDEARLLALERQSSNL